MSFPRNGRRQGASFHNDLRSSFNSNNSNQHNSSNDCFLNGMPRKFRDQPIYNFRINEDVNPLKRRKFSSSEDGQRYYRQPNIIGNAPSTSTSLSAPSTRPDVNGCTLTGHKRDRSKIDEEIVFFSRDEIERLSPSRKDGIDSLRETFLRFSYCSFLQHLGARLDLPQTTVGTAMVLCHRFFVRRSHASHDRFVIATAALFLSAKSEETPCPLNSVLRASYDICYKQDLSFFPYLLPVDWFEQYRERVIEAEHVILTTLDFELNVQHPYVPLTSALNKLGLSQTVLTNLALNLVSEGIFTRIACSPVYILSWRIDMLFLEKFCFTSEVELLMCCGYIFHETPFSSLSLVIGVAADISEPLLHFTYLHFVFVLVDFYSSLVETISLSNIAVPTLTLKVISTTWIILGSGHKTKIMSFTKTF